MLFRRNQSSVVVFAPAKLNLFLQVLGRRADGFHELETLMVSVGLYDVVRLSLPAASERHGDIKLRCIAAGSVVRGVPRENCDLPLGRENLVVRAAELLRETVGGVPGVKVDLVKRIPLAAGLAGGSSDAAATLAGLNILWQLGLSSRELQGLAARLGSDVPFFLAPSAAAVCRGRGEIIEPVPFPLRLHFVIVRPRTGLSTRLVFQHCQPAPATRPVEVLVEHLRQGRLAHAGGCFYNALQVPAEQLNADVRRLKAAFSRLPFRGCQMSGSGTSYFGLCTSRRQALHLSARLKSNRLGDVFVARSRP